MSVVTSPDGTRIAYERGGAGPPLVLVHGTTADRSTWERVLPDLREHFTVYAMDRRGRGGSGDADEYDIEREFEDVAALCEAIDRPVGLLGHSYGALCALGAAPTVESLERLVLYEPPVSVGDGQSEGGKGNENEIENEGAPGEVFDRMADLVAAGEYEAVLETFFREVTDGADRLEIYRSQPSWEGRVAAAPTVPRELRTVSEFHPPPEHYADVTVPTLVLRGSETRDSLAAATEAVHESLPRSELVVLEGAGHAAMYTAPEEFVSTVSRFLAGGD